MLRDAALCVVAIWFGSWLAKPDLRWEVVGHTGDPNVPYQTDPRRTILLCDDGFHERSTR